MADIEPQGLPAVKLKPLRELRKLDALSDEAMVNVQRLNLLDAAAPNPSVETLLHAFLPHKFIDHTHAAAVLALVDQPDGEALAREVYNGRMGIVPYIAPGFGLAKAAAEVFEQNPKVEGLILHKHGIFTFGESAREAYERMIEMVSLAESRLRQGRPVVFQPRKSEAKAASAAEIAPIIRGACALPSDKVKAEPTRFVMTFPHRAGDSRLCQWRRASGLQPARRGHARPHHPHQEHAAGAAAAGAEQAEGLRRTCARVRLPISARATMNISRARTQPKAIPRPSSTRRRAWCWCLASACSAWAARRRTRIWPPISPRTRCGSLPTPKASAATSRCRRAICSSSNIGAWSRPS